MSVAKVLLPQSHLVTHVRRGKQALTKAARSGIVESARTKIVDSIDLDAASAGELPDDNRWDYLLGLRSGTATVIAVEVHPATAKEAKRVVAKKKAALDYLKAHWKTDRPMPAKWYWIASGRVALPPTTPAYRALVSAGIEFEGARLVLER